MTESMAELWDWLVQTMKTDFIDGQWEHTQSVTIDTIDNPGWSFKFDLDLIDSVNAPMERIRIARSDTDWVFCWKEDNTFHGACGVDNLPEVLSIFKEWWEETKKQIDAENLDRS